MDSRTIDFNSRRSSQMTGASSTAARLRSSTSVASGGRASRSASSVVGSRLGGSAQASAGARRGMGAVYGGSAPAGKRGGGLRAAFMRPIEALSGFIARVGQRVFVTCLVLGVIGLSVGLLYGPVRNYYVACRTNEYLSAQLATLTEQNERVEQQIEALQTQEGIEDEARRRGYVEVGSTPVNVTGLPQEEGEQIAGNGAIKIQQAEELPWYTEALDSLFNYTPPEA